MRCMSLLKTDGLMCRLASCHKALAGYIFDDGGRLFRQHCSTCCILDMFSTPLQLMPRDPVSVRFVQADPSSPYVGLPPNTSPTNLGLDSCRATGKAT